MGLFRTIIRVIFGGKIEKSRVFVCCMEAIICSVYTIGRVPIPDPDNPDPGESRSQCPGGVRPRKANPNNLSGYDSRPAEIHCRGIRIDSSGNVGIGTQGRGEAR